MTRVAKTHKALEKKLFHLRASGELTEEEDDRIVEEMADLWWQMNIDEQAAFRKRAEAWAEKEKP